MMTTPVNKGSNVILVVDDQEATRIVFSQWLRRAGYEVHEAATGAEAIAALSRLHFDLALLDVHLPDMSGLEVCGRIKTARATAAMPVLHVSATATASPDRVRGLDHGADAYLVEPVERGELLSTVAALLRHNESLRSAEQLAARLERLHQTTLLLNASSSLAELIGFAATGAASIFGAATVLAVARNGFGWVARAAPNSLDATIEACPATAVLKASGDPSGEIDLQPLADDLSPTDEMRATPILTPRGELVGAIALLGPASIAEDALLLDHFTQALAGAIENQRIYDVEHQIALTLQRTMLPQSIPAPQGLEVAVRYQAASHTVEIGGDFYEVMELDEHRTLLAIGDVVGHSLLAATVMAELRYSLRAFADLGLEPGDIIDRLNRLLMKSHPGFSATLCIAIVDTARDEVLVTNAGHPPPLVRVGDHTAFIDRHGPLIGIRLPAHPPTLAVPFGDGALLVLVTDGLVERRGEDLDVGLTRLAETVAGFHGEVDDLHELLLREVGAGGDTADDVAIVVARRSA